MVSADDRQFMERAFALARSHHGQTGTNPSVGCVLVLDGVVLAESATAPGGRPHAEELALATLGGRAEGAVAYVTLEPCRERSGGTASCSERLIAAGVSRVVAASADLHPLGSGGFRRLATAGVRVELLPMPSGVAELYTDFFRAVVAEKG